MANLHMDNHLFWGINSPLSSLAGGGILVLASSRTAFAALAFGSLLWMYGLTALVYGLAWRLFPRKGKDLVFISLSSAFGGLFLLIIFLTNPLIAIQTQLFLMLVPVYGICSGFPSRIAGLDLQDGAIRALSEASLMGALTLAIALVREPLGLGSLSIPGGPRGIISLALVGEGAFFPLGIFASSSGALFILGYGVAAYRFFKKRNTPAGEGYE